MITLSVWKQSSSCVMDSQFWMVFWHRRSQKNVQIIQFESGYSFIVLQFFSGNAALQLNPDGNDSPRFPLVISKGAFPAAPASVLHLVP